MRDREIRTENQFGIFSRGVRVMSDSDNVDLKWNREIPCKQLENTD